MAGAGDEHPMRRTLPVTSVRDGLEHLVADEVMTHWSAGRYVAVGGREMWARCAARFLAASLVEPGRAQCQPCREQAAP